MGNSKSARSFSEDRRRLAEYKRQIKKIDLRRLQAELHEEQRTKRQEAH